MAQQLTIRNVPDEVIDALKAEAEEDSVSVNAIVRSALIERAEHWKRIQRMRDALPRLDALRRKIAEEHGGYLPDSTAMIREDRER